MKRHIVVMDWKICQFSPDLFVCVCVCVFTSLLLSVTPHTVIHQAPLSMEFSRQEYWSRWPFPTPEDHPDPGIEPTSLMAPALADRFFTTSATIRSLQFL